MLTDPQHGPLLRGGTLRPDYLTDRRGHGRNDAQEHQRPLHHQALPRIGRQSGTERIQPCSSAKAKGRHERQDETKLGQGRGEGRHCVGNGRYQRDDCTTPVLSKQHDEAPGGQPKERIRQRVRQGTAEIQIPRGDPFHPWQSPQSDLREPFQVSAD